MALDLPCVYSFGISAIHPNGESTHSHQTATPVTNSSMELNEEALARAEEILSRPQPPASLPPAKDPTPQTADNLIAQELNRLSLDDRNKIVEQIHGVDKATLTDGDDIKLQSDLNELEKEISFIKSADAYRKATSMDPEFVSRRSFRLKFLRAESFNPKDAARRLAAFFEFKLALFGAERLTQEIKMKDLMADPDDREALEAGVFQRLASRDRSGRIVICKFQKHEFMSLKMMSRLRVFWYLIMTAMEREQDQRKGIVIVVFNMEGVVDRVETWKNSTLLGSLPAKVPAFHVCHNDPKITAVSALAQLALGPYYRARFRSHEGSVLENVYALLTFGISSQSIPLKPGAARLDVAFHLSWIKQRVEEEAQVVSSSSPGDTEMSIAGKPEPNDVVFGRGKSSQNHPGNVRLREMIDASRPNYELAKLLEKTLIAEKIVQAIKTSGRFLKQDGKGGWIEVNDDAARDKISHTFRDQRRKHKQNGATTKRARLHVPVKVV